MKKRRKRERTCTSRKAPVPSMLGRSIDAGRPRETIAGTRSAAGARPSQLGAMAAESRVVIRTAAMLTLHVARVRRDVHADWVEIYYQYM